jgi:hypothetical protein
VACTRFHVPRRRRVDHDALSQADLDRARGEFDASKAAVFAASAKVKEAELNLGYTAIRSPVTVLASRAQQRQGAYINAQSDSANLTYVAAIDPIWVNFSVSQNLAAKLRDETAKKLLIEPKNRDYEVEIVLSDNTPYPHRGKINFADPSFSQDTGSFLVRAVLPNPKRELRPGMFVTAHVKGALRPNAIVGTVKKREEATAQAKRVPALREYARLSRLRFDNGYASYLEVLYTENELFGAELGAVRSQADSFTQIINVYGAVGGGWVIEADKLAPQPAFEITQHPPPSR